MHVDESHAVLMEVASATVMAYKAQFGRGPTRARATWCGETMLTVVLEDTLTRAERNLIAIGEQQRVRDARACLQRAARPELSAAIERITGRTVRTVISGMDAEGHGVCTEVFVLEPADVY